MTNHQSNVVVPIRLSTDSIFMWRPWLKVLLEIKTNNIKRIVAESNYHKGTHPLNKKNMVR